MLVALDLSCVPPGADRIRVTHSGYGEVAFVGRVVVESNGRILFSPLMSG